MLTRAEEIKTLAVMVLAIVDPDHTAADHLESVSFDDDSRRLVDSEAEQLWVSADDLNKVISAAPGENMLIDGHAPKVAEALLVAVGHQNVVTIAGAAHLVRALDSGAGGAASDHTAALEDCLDFALGARPQKGVDDPPLPAAIEPDRSCLF
jgi:hypothetical protein